MRRMKFYELAIGAEFRVWGRAFKKTAMSMAQVLDDGPERGWGTIFRGETEVESEGPLLPVEVAERWRPPEEYWADHLTPAPGQTGRLNGEG